ncbi:hypothetical protein RE92_07765 [Paenibacillus polymyxa]|nr:hypothetical protein RE92_07765 [Paenibacillus polymyxa]
MKLVGTSLIQQRFYVGANGWLKASLLEPCAFLEGLRAVCCANSAVLPETLLVIEKRVPLLFHRSWEGAASYVPHLFKFCSHMRVGAGSSGADGIVPEKR